MSPGFPRSLTSLRSCQERSLPVQAEESRLPAQLERAAFVRQELPSLVEAA